MEMKYVIYDAVYVVILLASIVVQNPSPFIVAIQNLSERDVTSDTVAKILIEEYHKVHSNYGNNSKVVKEGCKFFSHTGHRSAEKFSIN